MINFGILKERKNPPDKRVVLTPQACQDILSKFDAKITVEPSSMRVFSDSQYEQIPLEVQSDLSQCDVLLGVKEVPIETLIPNKKYFFFSHTIKKQPYNRALLQAVLKNKITLYDHEVITNPQGARLVAFGRYAGIVGAYNGLRTFGLKYQLFKLLKATHLEDLKALFNRASEIQLPPIKIVLTGCGRVGNGAVEVLEKVGVKKVSIDSFLKDTFEQAVYCQIDVMDYNERIDGEEGSKIDFFENPEAYQSNFYRFARVSDLFIAGHFYGQGAPYLFSREDSAQPDFNIKVVADISCDIDGPVATTVRATTIAEPIYGIDPKSYKEIPFTEPHAIAVMSVDNLPCELPKDASEGFSEAFVEYVIPAFFNGDSEGILSRAQMTTPEGTLTERYGYLQDYVDGKN